MANPDLAEPAPPLAVLPAVFTARTAAVTAATGLDRRRLLEWVLARAGLSAAWFAQDGDPLIDVERAVADLAAAALDA